MYKMYIHKKEDKDRKSMVEEIKEKISAEPRLSVVSKEFLSGFIFLRDICGATHDIFSEVLNFYCEKEGIDFDALIEKYRAEHERNNGRPIDAPLSETTEEEFVSYIEKCKKIFPVINHFLL